MSADDFRIRRTPAGYKVWQRVGPGWEGLADVYETRADARTAVTGFACANSPASSTDDGDVSIT